MTAKIDAITFEAGIVSELTEARHTVLNHGRACRQLRNMISWPQGPVTADPGTAFLDSLDAKGRLIRVTYSEDQAFLALFTDRKVRFYADDGVVQAEEPPE